MALRVFYDHGKLILGLIIVMKRLFTLKSSFLIIFGQKVIFRKSHYIPPSLSPNPRQTFSLAAPVENLETGNGVEK